MDERHWEILAEGMGSTGEELRILNDNLKAERARADSLAAEVERLKAEVVRAEGRAAASLYARAETAEASLEELRERTQALLNALAGYLRWDLDKHYKLAITDAVDPLLETMDRLSASTPQSDSGGSE